MPVFRFALLFLLLSVSPLQDLLACDCVSKPKLEVKDWNNTEVIFLATLSSYKANFRVNRMTFHIMEMIKGDINQDSVDVYFQPEASHTLVHAIKEIKAGQTWIVFAQKEQGRSRVHIRLRDTEIREFCALSKPVDAGTISENPFMQFLYEMKTPQKEGFEQFQNQKGTLVAEGNYDDGLPVGTWKYYAESGKIQNEGSYLEGKKNGDWKIYQELDDQHFLKKIELFDHNSIKLIKIFNPAGAISYSKEFLENGSKTSNYILDGILKEVVIENEDENYFKVIKYYPSGHKKEEKEIRDNVLTSHVIFDEEGNEVRRIK